HVIDRSQGQLVDITFLYDYNDELLRYVKLFKHVYEAGQFWWEWAPPQVTQLSSTALTGAGAGAEAWFFLSKSNARTISLSSATSDEIAGVEEFVLTLATTALARV
ncbi:hypothetical protein Tco_1126582, partial [Tanacetum coccineum]